MTWSSHESAHGSQSIEEAEIMNKQIEAARATGKNQQCSKKRPWDLDHQKQISENLFSSGSNPNISMSVYQNTAPNRMLTTQTQKYWQKCEETEWILACCSWGCKLSMVDPQRAKRGITLWPRNILWERHPKEVRAWTWRNSGSSIINCSKGLATQASIDRQIHK